MEWGQGMKVAYDQDMLKILRNKLKLKKIVIVMFTIVNITSIGII